tara:strand:+ start:50 stop:460 length:411 start_codon:yes stop_codon:yes gene_type:complete
MVLKLQLKTDMNDKERLNKVTNWLSLFASTSTLICCALPSFFVLLGAGASFVSLLSFFPFLITISEYKIFVSLTAVFFISVAGYINYKTYYLPCPADPVLGEICNKTRRRSRILYYFSVILFLFASFLTYIMPKII